MMITEELIEYLAGLSQIQLDDKQRTHMLDELNKILDYMKILDAVDTTGLAPMPHIFAATNVMRSDIVTTVFERDALLQNAPECTDEAFIVPKIVG